MGEDHDHVGLVDSDRKNCTHYPIVTSIPSTPVTETRKPFIAPEDSTIKEFGVPRVNIAIDPQYPNGTTENGWAEKHKNMTVLQQHISYFDVDGDGLVTPLETYNAARRLGFSPLVSLFGFLVNFGFSWPSQGYPDPRFRIKVAGIAHCKHGSDSGTFDNEGRFRPQQFEDIFQKYSSHPERIGLRYYDILRMLACQMVFYDIPGAFVAFAEWTLLYVMLYPADGYVTKSDLRAMYDGSLFFTIADKVAVEKRAKNS